MSTVGNVPSQGVDVKAATTEKKRGSRCTGKPTGYTFGKGTPGKRLKSAWHAARKHGYKESLRTFVRMEAKYKGTDPDATALAEDATGWLERKAS